MIKVEKELERLNREIDQPEGTINKMDHMISYSTITVYYEEKTKPGVLSYLSIGIYKGVK